MIPEQFLQQIRSIPIETVAAQYFHLKKVNNVYQTHCIHEGDREPSLTFFLDTNTFYCFGCGAGEKPITEGSDVISFLMWIEGISFIEAVHRLASMQGWEVPNSNLSKEEKEKKRLMSDVLNKNRLYWSTLQSSPRVLQYLFERGIDREDIDKWRIGLTPMEGEKYPGRLVFPIMNLQGQTVGFSYRNMSDVLGISDDLPKYINSSNSAVFDKGSILYGLNFVKRLVQQKEYVILVEGYADVIIGQKYGLPVVGLMGTSLTQNQIKLLKQYTDTVVLWMDGDRGGVDAALRHSKELTNHGFLAKIIHFPKKDPDEIILSFAPSNEFSTLEEYLLEHSYLSVQFELDQILKRFDSDEMELKLKTIQRIKPILRSLKNADELEPYLHYAARRLDVSVEFLKEGMNKDDNNEANSRPHPRIVVQRKLQKGNVSIPSEVG